MSIDARVKAIIENRKNNFYSMFDEYDLSTEKYLDDNKSPYYGRTVSEIYAAVNRGENVPADIVKWADNHSKPRFTEQPDPDFDMVIGFDSDGNPIFDEDKLKAYNKRIGTAKALKIRIEANANICYTDDESSDFFGYSYEEIIGMANNGTVIPDEILNWAYSMAEKNPHGETTDNPEDANDAQVLYRTLKQNPNLNIKTIAKIFTFQCVKQENELESYLEELAPIEKEMETARVEAETQRADALIKIKDLAKEWKDLKSKVESGEELSAEEQTRFEELKDEFGAEDKKYQKAIDSATKNFTQISERLTFVSGKADTTFDFGEQTVEVAKELAEFEKTHRRGSVFGGLILAGIAGVLGINGSGGVKRFSEIATTVGTNTQ